MPRSASPPARCRGHHLAQDGLAYPLDLAGPRHSGQVVALVPSRAPLPEQVAQLTGALRLTSRRVPNTASASRSMHHDLGVGALTTPSTGVPAGPEALIEKGRLEPGPASQAAETEGSPECQKTGYRCRARHRGRTCRSACQQLGITKRLIGESDLLKAGLGLPGPRAWRQGEAPGLAGGRRALTARLRRRARNAGN